MSHHASGPNFGFPRGDAQLDMTDPYAFPTVARPNRTKRDFDGCKSGKYWFISLCEIR